MFLPVDFEAGSRPCLDSDHTGPSDHIPLVSVILVTLFEAGVAKQVLPKDSDEKADFLDDVITGIQALTGQDLNSQEDVEHMASAIASIVSKAWDTRAKDAWIVSRSKPW